jgi:hypothetical protein
MSEIDPSFRVPPFVPPDDPPDVIDPGNAGFPRHEVFPPADDGPVVEGPPEDEGGSGP